MLLIPFTVAYVVSPKSSINSEPLIEDEPPFYYPFFSKADLAEERWNVGSF